MDLFNLPAPQLHGLELIPNVSSNFRAFYRPWTFAFLNPELSAGMGVVFTGTGFYPQHNTGKTLDMETTAGGDTYDLCGSESYRVLDVQIDSVMGAGSFRRRVRRRYAPIMVDPPEGEEGPPVFSGLYSIQETVENYDDDLGVAILQERVTAPDKAIYYEWRGTGTDYSVVGQAVFQEEVTHSYLNAVGSEWQTAIIDAPGDPFLFGGGEEVYHRSETKEGQDASIAFGVLAANPADSSWPVFGDEDPEYTLAGIGVVFEMETRRNKPVVYEETGPGIIGNAIYGRGKAVQTLQGLITTKKWKDDFGIFDQDQDALNDLPWRPAATWFAGYHRLGFGEVSCGRFTSLGGRYRVTLGKPGEEGEAAEEALSVIVGPDEPADYHFPFVATDAAAYTPELLKIERENSEDGWDLIDPATYYTVLAGEPAMGALLMHWRRGRFGFRWGHFEFVDPADPPPTPADQKRYRLMVHNKSATS